MHRTEGTFIGSAEYAYDVRNNLTNLITTYGGNSVEQRYSYSQNSLSANSATYAKDNLPTVYQLYDERYAVYEYDNINRINQRMFNLKNTPLYYNYIYKLSDRNGTGESLYRTHQVEEEYIGNDVYIYGYDVLGNITSIKKADRKSTDPSSSNFKKYNSDNLADYVTYTYDNLGQLTRENLVDEKTTVWNYDELGNITSKSEYDYTTGTVGTPTKTIAYGYGKDSKSGWNNLLISVDLDGDGVGANDKISYDKIGNPTTYLGATLAWNGRQLTNYTKGDTTVSYKYDADGLRTSKTVNGVTSKYFYVNGQLHYEERTDGTKLYFFYDSNGYLSAIEYNGTNYYPATNQRGDVVAIYRYTGDLYAKYEYDAWGNVISVKNASGNPITSPTHIANVNPIRYRGYYYDAETKLYYLQSRYYNAEVGRFLNADGYITTGQGVLSYNMFAYCQNNPVMFSDPTGTFGALAILGILYVATAVSIVVAGTFAAHSSNSKSYTPSKSDNKTGSVDITDKLDDAMEENSKALEDYTETHNYVESTVYFVDKVKPGGEWDFKSQSSWNLDANTTYSYNGIELRYDDIGNIHYGYVGRVLYNQNILLMAGGFVQIFTGTSSLDYCGFYFDDPQDQWAIEYGSILWDNEVAY